MHNFTKRIGQILLCAVISAKICGQSPVITGFTPAVGVVGSLVTISGTNLDNATMITIGGVKAVPISNTSTMVVAMVMQGASTGNISTTTPGGSYTTADAIIIKRANAPTVQQGTKLVGTGNTGASYQGRGVAISADGNTAVVGGFVDNGSVGAVWIFTRSSGVWSQQGTKLVGTGSVGIAEQGYSVAISADGNTVLVGAPEDNSFLGACWVFTRTGGVWTQQGNKLVGGPLGGHQEQGTSVALSADGNTALIGSPQYGSLAGMNYVFTRDAAGVWTQQAALQGSGAVGNAAGQGTSVSLSADGNTALIGGFSDAWIFTGIAKGAAWVFTRTGSAWTQQGSKLFPNDAVVSADILFGKSVSLSADGNTALIGGSRDNGNNGAAWIFTRNSGVWTQQGSKLVGTGTLMPAEQGSAVALSADGNIAYVGGPEDRQAVGGGGATWVFTRNGGVWAQVGSKLIGTGNVSLCWQGTNVAVSADGSTGITGGWADNFNIGAAWVFQATPRTLPVRWLSLQAKFVSSAEVMVEWSTGAEINNVSFDVERSVGGSSNQFNAVGSVAANNNSSSNNKYSLKDRYSFSPGQSYYYRIKQTDVDGRSSYSPIVRVQSGTDLQNMSWQVFPNPARGGQSVNLVAMGNIRQDEWIELQIINASGQVLEVLNERFGNLNARFGNLTQHLRSGTYTINIKNKSAVCHARLMIL